MSSLDIAKLWNQLRLKRQITSRPPTAREARLRLSAREAAIWEQIEQNITDDASEARKKMKAVLKVLNARAEGMMRGTGSPPDAGGH